MIPVDRSLCSRRFGIGGVGALPQPSELLTPKKPRADAARGRIGAPGLGARIKRAR